MITAMGDVMREAYKRGWITSRDGNISIRRSGYIYITPTAVRKYIIHPEHIVKLKAQWSSDTCEGPEDGSKPSIEFDMHFNIHLDRKKTGAVVHLHPTHTIAAMYAGLDLASLVLEFPELGRYTKVGPMVDSFAPGSDELAKYTAENIRGYDIVGQKNHGVTAYGANPWDAFEHIERLEHICEIVLKSGKSVE